MEKKAKIIATLGPAIYSENKLKKLVDLGVDAFRINFSHNTEGIKKIVSKIRKVEKKNGKKLSLIADLQGVKLRIGKVKNESQQIKFNQRFIFDSKQISGDSKRVNFPHPKIIKKLKKFQLPLELKKKRSDFIIKNNFRNNFIKKNVKKVMGKILLNA